MTASHEEHLTRLQEKIWKGSVPLEIRLARSECRTFDESDPYFIQVYRLSYLPFLLRRLHTFFKDDLIDPDSSASHDGWFSYESVPLKWHYPVGLLFDLYTGAEPATSEDQGSAATLKGLQPGSLSSTKDLASQVHEEVNSNSRLDAEPAGSEESNDKSDSSDRLPWRLTVHFSDWPAEDLIRLDTDGRVLLDAFRNSVKEASFIRHGTGKVVMSLGYEDSTQMWTAVQDHNLDLYLPMHTKLLDPPGMTLKNLPIRLYLPSTVSLPRSPPITREPEKAGLAAGTEEESPAVPGTLRIVQALVPPTVPGVGSRRQPQTVGMVLNKLLPALFPSRRSPLLALPVLHGAVLPLAANAEELARTAAFADGWLHLSIRMLN